MNLPRYGYWAFNSR